MGQLLRALREKLRLDDAVARLAGREARVVEQRPVEAEQGRDAADLELVERAQHAPPRLLPIEIEAGHELGDGVLDLDARVHLEEVVVALTVEQALDGPGALVADRPSSVDRDLADAGPELVVDRRRRRLLDELLVAPLDRAVALDEADHVSMGVGEDLDLD